MSARQFLAQQIAAAAATRAASLPTLFQAAGHAISNNGRADCPWCGTTASLRFRKQDGRWRFACEAHGCQAQHWGDEVDFLILQHGLDEPAAIRRLLETAGMPDQWQDPPHDAATPTATTDDPPPDSDPRFIRLPENERERNPYEAAWLLLSLTDRHREELRSKRGMPDPWIDALGFKSAVPANEQALAPILELFPPNVLLRAGIATRDSEQQLRVSATLCGRSFDPEEKRWVTREAIIIPYIDEHGRIELLRPHKRSLSNARWREREVVSEHYEKLHHNLRIPYGKHFLANRPPRWKHNALVTEGEFKSCALAIAGIPSVAFQGIHFFLQNRQHQQAVNDTVEILRQHDVRETIVVFDNEDKSHKPLPDQFETETFARYTAECLEDAGFRSLFGVLPDDWREGGEKTQDGSTVKAKADWDSRLAWHVRRAKGDFAAGIARASAEFHKFLDHRSGKDPAIRPSPRQIDWIPSVKEDIIAQALHRLRHIPEIFEGGQHELDTATEVRNWCHEHYADRLRVSSLCEALRKTVGGYYLHKPPSELLEKRAIEALDELRKAIAELEDSPRPDEAELRRLRAARTAAYTILYRNPRPFTDFTAVSKYKIRAWDQNGLPKLDRLVIFIDKNGRRSRAFQMPPEKMGSSQELRKFFLSQGGYHWWGNQDECDKWVLHLDVQNYQKEIQEIDTYGWNQDHRFYIFGDCAVADGGRFLFPDKHGIIWHRGQGFKNSEAMTDFAHFPPCLFPGCANPREAFNAMDWDAERIAVQEIWNNLLADYHESFGGEAGYAVVAGILQYMAHPETLRMFGKPGLWIQGEKGSGKTKSIEFLMQLFGFPPSYGPISLGSTKVGLERFLSHYRCFPIHIDEWRNSYVDPRVENLLTNSFQEIATGKGTMTAGKSVRKSIPLTIPIITGEDGTGDPALRSRYVKIITSKHHFSHIDPDESAGDREIREREEEERKNDRFLRLTERSAGYYRVGRYLFRFREQFAAGVVAMVAEFKNHPRAIESVGEARGREVLGTFLGSLITAHEIICGEQLPAGREFTSWVFRYGAEASEEVERDIFRRRFFAECVTMLGRGVHGIEKLIRVRRCTVASDGRVTPLKQIDGHEGRLLILVRGAELFAEYEADLRRRTGRDSPISVVNIIAELRVLPCWIKPNHNKARQQRFSLPGEPGGSATWWTLDWNLCEPEMQDIFRPVYEQELDKVGLMLAQDGTTIVESPELQESMG